ncbi:GNAT family N-acetyltransferase [Mycolicibacterium sp. Dal123E01]|uniref:GNAT family N-acetyltransferase n=1 Tax=Mycolicibacterium sp. Dal123E01 TaxID=3457578 RepID=UPI00403EDDEE
MVELATASDVDELAEVAAATFPLACPPSTPRDAVDAFVSAHLSSPRFADYLTDPTRTVLAARDGGRIVGYAILIDGVGDDADVARAVISRPAVELSKIYVLPDSHGSGTAGALMAAAVAHAHAGGARCLWLGVNQKNERAQRFYTKHGFTIVGTKSFPMGTHTEHDYVLARPL